MTLIDRLDALGKTIIIITHDMKVVAAHSRRVLVMADGQLILDSPTEKLFDNAGVLAAASLKPPQRLEMARELGLSEGPGIPSVEELTARLRGSFAKPGPS
jgi:energy-coupling factor transport system ATP-binding protein